ncbi:TPA: hypothetical protein K8979_004436 [Escherichia coli]|nr:hypothetical protein [Escherichia coli]EKK2832577.1 hypothetical protein [Escherichia coli O33]ELN6011926.1 hypothetical protein [Escherichia coli]EMA1415890.1 hypothetical protein [Escherichia coli]EMA1575992.1 hypothetical protein [Escherichia coli]
MPSKRVICSLDEQELDILEKYKLHYKNKHGVKLNRTVIIKMLISRLSKEIQ